MRNYVAFNALTITGIISDVRKVNGKNGEFLGVTMISTLVTDGAETTITFTNNNVLMSFFDKGYLPKGRKITVTGHIAGITEIYEDEEGQVRLLKRPQLKLTGATILDGGLGPSPKGEGATTIDRSKTVVRPSDAPKAAKAPADATPVF